MEYVLELKQIVDYPKVRIYREFIQKLIYASELSNRGNSNLFNYMVLCSFANYRSSRKRIEGKEFLIGPGCWLCKTSELFSWFNTDSTKQVEVIMDYLMRMGLIEYEYYLDNQYVFYEICEWTKNNTALEYEAHCQKDSGFFFFPISDLNKLLNGCKCSGKDIVMDLWLNTIYNDSRVDGSTIAPVVYFRNGTGSPRTTYSFLAKRYGISKASICRVLQKLNANGYITYLSFSGRTGTVIYLDNYLSIMFEISDVPVDKEEVAFTLKVKLRTDNNREKSEENIVSEEKIIVSKSEVENILPKLLETLLLCGFDGCQSQNAIPILYSLSDCKVYIFKVLYREKELYKFLLEVKEDKFE